MSVYERLESLEKIGIKLGLRNIKVILEALGQPQNSFRSVLIAGTNGKGSTGAILESILRIKDSKQVITLRRIWWISANVFK